MVIETKNGEQLHLETATTSGSIATEASSEPTDYFLYTGCKPTPRVLVDSSVQSIGDGAFRDCKELVMLKFSDEGRLKRIGMNAFRRCTSLQRIIIPSSVEVLDQSAFGYCTKLMNVVLNEGLEYLGDSVFEGCASLRQVTIPTTVIVIGHCAFRNCTKLKHVQLNEGLEHIEDQSFEGCISLQQIDIPSTVEDIGHCAFSTCTRLMNVTLNEGLEYIDCQAFEETSIERISIPSTVKVIKSQVFRMCQNLVAVQFCDEIEAFVSKTSLRDWWHRGSCETVEGGTSIKNIIFCNVINSYVFLSQRNIAKRFEALKSTTWQMDINNMLKWDNICRDVCNPNWDAVELKLEHYEYLEERAFLLELVLWKWKIKEQLCAQTHGNLIPMRSQHRIACGANIILPKVLSFLSGEH